MKVGIMSDSHDNIDNIKKALELFKKHDVHYVIHAGDLISPFCVSLFSDFKGKLYMCKGNNSGDIELVKSKFKDIGIFFDEVGEFIISNKKFALYHGTNEVIKRALVDSQKYDYVVIGHTHKKELSTTGVTTIINPGETFGKLFGKATVAILDLESNNVEFYEID